MTKMAKIDTLFMTKTATLWGRKYLYSPYKEVPPLGNYSVHHRDNEPLQCDDVAPSFLTRRYEHFSPCLLKLSDIMFVP